MNKAKDFTKLRDKELKEMQKYRADLSNKALKIAQLEKDKTIVTYEYIDLESDYHKFIGKLQEKYGNDKIFNAFNGEITKKTSSE